MSESVNVPDPIQEAASAIVLWAAAQRGVLLNEYSIEEILRDKLQALLAQEQVDWKQRAEGLERDIREHRAAINTKKFIAPLFVSAANDTLWNTLEPQPEFLAGKARSIMDCPVCGKFREYGHACEKD